MSKMGNRQRIINTIVGDEIDRPPFFFYFGPWQETLDRWHREGLSKGTDWTEGLGFDEGIEVLPVNLDYLTDFWIVLYDKASEDVKIDIIHIWEDFRYFVGRLKEMTGA